MNIKKVLAASVAVVSLFLTATPALAHVSVKPDQVGIGATQDFTVSFGIEKDIPTTSVRLVIPEGVTNVTPYMTPGWKIDTKKEGSGEDAKVTEIVWSGGSVPAGYRQTFQLRAQVPASEQTLKWKAYQTYSDGTIQSWDQEPQANLTDEQREEMEKTGMGPYSATKVINDLKASSTSDTYSNNVVQSSTQSNLPLVLSGLAVLLSVGALAMQFRKK